jgi:transcriptional regulator GlxA family with amidase domain
MRADILVFPGFDELDAIGPFEVLRNARSLGAEIECRLVTIDGNSEITASHGLVVRPTGKVGDGPRADVVIVPGGGWNNRASQGAWAEAKRGVIPAEVARLHREGATIASVCTGAMLVAAAGLMSGRPAITHHAATGDLRASGAEIIEARVVDDGDLVSAGGVTSGLDLALWLVERNSGAEVARNVEELMEYQRRGPIWNRANRAARAQGQQ